MRGSGNWVGREGSRALAAARNPCPMADRVRCSTKCSDDRLDQHAPSAGGALVLERQPELAAGAGSCSGGPAAPGAARTCGAALSRSCSLVSAGAQLAVSMVMWYATAAAVCSCHKAATPGSAISSGEHHGVGVLAVAPSWRCTRATRRRSHAALAVHPASSLTTEPQAGWQMCRQMTGHMSSGGLQLLPKAQQGCGRQRQKVQRFFVLRLH